MKKIWFIFLFIFSLSYADQTAKDWLESKIKTSSGIQAKFIQKTYQSDSKLPEIFSGTLTASKPFNIRVDYSQPFQQILFTTQEKTILYTPSENQAIVSKKDIDNFMEDIVAIFLQTKPLKSVFDVVQDTESKLTLKPKNNPDIRLIDIYIQNNTIQSITAIDRDNNRVELEFKTFKFLTQKPQVELNIPPNTKIINY
ncbi:MAG: outer membrane lipoprotein carrier protein LolA [Hydrogenothermaceae bacterium]|nr:outer membrane lipoprotein carrier protein LolA [Hydrogenothermaceae bacterium]